MEGIAFRIVTSSHPGDPALEEFGCPRTEYVYSTDPLGWTMKRDEAIRFPTHRDAEKFAHPNKWHAAVADATRSPFVPERLLPLATEALTELRERPPRQPRKKRLKNSRLGTPAATPRPVVSQRLWWKEKEAYS